MGEMFNKLGPLEPVSTAAPLHPDQCRTKARPSLDCLMLSGRARLRTGAWEDLRHNSLGSLVQGSLIHKWLWHAPCTKE